MIFRKEGPCLKGNFGFHMYCDPCNFKPVYPKRCKVASVSFFPCVEAARSRIPSLEAARARIPSLDPYGQTVPDCAYHFCVS